jgi:hypothetical protein
MGSFLAVLLTIIIGALASGLIIYIVGKLNLGLSVDSFEVRPKYWSDFRSYERRDSGYC